MKLWKVFLVLSFCFVYDMAEELCIWETFSASCSSGEVISIERAIFGRMRSNRCFNMTVNEPNCSVDIRHQLQSHLGLQRNIHVILSSEFLTKNTPNCLNGQMPFLDLSHQCIKSITNEVCIYETFNATCPTGTTISIQSALFGRMRSSRCIEFDKDNLNCYANVQPYIESQCNGQSECKIKANDEKLKDIQGSCPKNLKPYLEVFYTCSQDYDCAKFNASEDVTIEDLAWGHRLSCIGDKNISWEVHCVNGSWISDANRSCTDGRIYSDSDCVKFNTTDEVTIEDIASGHRLSCIGDKDVSWEVHCVNGSWISDAKKSCTDGRIYSDFDCVKFNATEEVTIEDLASGHRLSCIRDKDVSWEVHCVNGSWISDAKRSCTDGRIYSGVLSFMKKNAITVTCVTVSLIIFLAIIAIVVSKRQQRNRQRDSSLYCEIGEIQPKTLDRYDKNAPNAVSEPSKNHPPASAPLPPLREPPSPPPFSTATSQSQRVPQAIIYQPLLPKEEDPGTQSEGGATTDVAVNIPNINITVIVSVAQDTKT